MTIIIVLFQLTLLVAAALFLSTRYMIFYQFFSFLSLLFAVIIVSDDINPSYKITWLMAVMLMPVFGWVLYLLFGRRNIRKSARKRFNEIVSESSGLTEDTDVSVLVTDPMTRRQLALLRESGAHIRNDTQTEYYPFGEVFFEALKEELSKAEKFIFMEYFIIDEGRMWDEIFAILQKKAADGVCVRVMFDDMGTIKRLPKSFGDKLKSAGIAVAVFNRLRPTLNASANYRDHRKITVIDGVTAFTGGVNLADEYINAIDVFGRWKDCAVCLRGGAAAEMTLMFLRLWNYSRLAREDEYKQYVRTVKKPADGVVAAFGDGPMSEKRTGERVYMSVINSAKKYVYIATPYLVPDNEMASSLKLAAESGIDVRIITPKIPDKWYVHLVTRSNYAQLMKSGVRIYEYTPGFIHSKLVVSDDETAIVATANFDYRSFYMHFENGVYMYKSTAVMQAADDYRKTLAESEEIALGDVNLGFFKSVLCCILKLFSPVM